MKILFNFLIILLLLSNSYILSQSISSIQFKNDALVLMNGGRYGEAIDQWNKYISENPQRADGFNYRGICFEKRGSYENAIYDYRTAKKLSPSDKEIASNLNRALNDWYKILYNNIEGYKREIAINPNLPKNYLEIGKCYKDLGDWYEAEIWYDSYLEKEEASADEILRYAEILAKNNHISKGEPILKSFTEKYPTDHRLWSKYGYFLMWLGKNKLAIDAFTKSLEIRPYFKEALDGLDLAKGKGYIYTINDTTSGFNYGMRPGVKEYAIDKYYRLLKNDPSDDQTRFKLIDELIKAKRFEEAYQQLEYLSPRYPDQKSYIELYDKIMTLRKSYYADRINYYKNLLDKDSNNRKAIIELGKFYLYSKDYDLTIQLYRNYLIQNPNDNEIRFRLVEILTWKNDLCAAKDEVNTLTKSDASKVEYQLLAARIYYWLDVDLTESKKLFNRVLEKEPNNLEALIGLANVLIRTEEVESAENIVKKIETIDKTNKDLSQLKHNLQSLQINKENQKQFQILEDARKDVSEGDYDQAISGFNQFLTITGKNKNVSLELADVYLKKSDVKNAIKIYDDILKSDYDYNIDKQKAKILYWQGDSVLALREFKKLVQKNPEDIEAKLFLGDAYLKNNQLQNARNVYNELLSLSPNSYIIKQRLSWTGGTEKFSVEDLPTYLQAIPQAYYFTDNTDFKLENFGFGLDMGLTNSVAIGIYGARGNLYSANDNLRFTQIKGSGYFKLNQFITGMASFGQTHFANEKQENIIDVTLTAVKKNVYLISGFLNYSDAAFILYSPFLVNTRLNAYYYGLNIDYRFKNNFTINGKAARLNISDNNEGNQFQGRIGKVFEDDISAGYEYYFYSFKKFTSLYWSPKNFESHSIWLDWNMFTDESTKFILGGKVGLIPQNDYILSEFFASLNYKILSSLSLTAKFTTGSSSRSNVGYRSKSLQAGIYWNL